MSIEEISERIADEIFRRSDKRLEANLHEKMNQVNSKDAIMTLATELLIESRCFTVDYVNRMLNEILKDAENN